MDNKFPPPLNFKPNGLFYPMVSSCITIVAGLSAILRKDKPAEFELKDRVALTSMFYQDALVYPHQISKNASQGYLSLDYVRHSLCMMLANLAYESAKAQNLSAKSPEWELLRHIRNASSHNNRFNFYEDEPRHPAYWRNLIIDHTQKGENNPRYNKACFGNFMEIAELLWLLKDIEANYETTKS